MFAFMQNLYNIPLLFIYMLLFANTRAPWHTFS